MSYDSWMTGIYNVYDGRFALLEAQDNIRQLEKIIKNNLGEHFLYENGKYKIQLKDEYEGYKKSETTEGND